MSVQDRVGSAFAKAAAKGLVAPAVLSRVTAGAYDPATGSAETVTNCATSSILDTHQKGMGFVFGVDLVKAGDTKATIPAKGLTFQPAQGDALTVLGSKRAVIAVMPTYAGAIPVMFELLVRG